MKMTSLKWLCMTAIGICLNMFAVAPAAGAPLSANADWTWMKGATNTYQHGIYGTQGMADPANTPGARNAAVTWTDLTGALWLFGGWGSPALGGPDVGLLNDLWKYNPATTNWTWIKGTNIVSQYGTYGTQDVPAMANTPGARSGAVAWTDLTGALWLFGGLGLDASGGYGYLNDLWKYNPATTNWTWMKGANIISQNGIYGTQGTANSSNTPGARESAVAWTDGSGALWLFGGKGYPAAGGYGDLNDLWKYDPATTNWTWMKGATNAGQWGICGTQGTADPANTPGARESAVSWTDGSGVLWLFGGAGYPVWGGTGNLNDLWKYDPATTNWTWMKGATNANQNGTYSTLGTADPANTPGARESAVAWTDGSGALWLFGGLGYPASGGLGKLNDLWKYDPATTNWTWMKGATNTDQWQTYGTQGVPSPANTPGARESAVAWTDGSGALWLFGGFGIEASGGYVSSGNLNDLWKYDAADNHPINDYDGDAKSDLAVYGDGYWSIYLMAGSVLVNNAGLWGGPGWTPVPGDYDGDGKSDLAVYSDGYWSIFSLANGLILYNEGVWGGPGWTPVPGDYDGDGKSDLAVYRDGYWSIFSLANGLILYNEGVWGGPGWTPVPGDYDGDGKADLAVYRNGYWSIFSLANGLIFYNQGVWGGLGWTTVPGDYNGDGKSDLAVYRDGYWSIFSLASGIILNNEGVWGGPSWITVSGDYDGDGKADLAVYRDGYWSIFSLANGIILNNEGVWGGPDWTPVR